MSRDIDTEAVAKIIERATQLNDRALDFAVIAALSAVFQRAQGAYTGPGFSDTDPDEAPFGGDDATWEIFAALRDVRRTRTKEKIQIVKDADKQRRAWAALAPLFTKFGSAANGIGIAKRQPGGTVSSTGYRPIIDETMDLPAVVLDLFSRTELIAMSVMGLYDFLAEAQKEVATIVAALPEEAIVIADILMETRGSPEVEAARANRVMQIHARSEKRKRKIERRAARRAANKEGAGAPPVEGLRFVDAKKPLQPTPQGPIDSYESLLGYGYVGGEDDE